MPDERSTRTVARRTTGARARRHGGLTRAEIIDASAAIVADEGIEAFTLRRVAADLDVTAMAIYRHVRDKDEILAEIVDRRIATLPLPDLPTDPWRPWLRAFMADFHHFLLTEPYALSAFAARPVTVVSMLRRMEAALGVLVDAGFDGGDAVSAYGALHTYTLGFSGLVVSRASASEGRDHAGTDAEGLGTGAPDAFPLVASLAPDLGGLTGPEQFGRGLDLLLEGIEAGRPGQGRGGSPPG